MGNLVRTLGTVLIALTAITAGGAQALRDDPLAPTRVVAVQDGGREYTLKLDDRPATFLLSCPAKSAREESGGAVNQLYPSYAAVPGNYLPSVEMAAWKGSRAEAGALAALLAGWDDETAGFTPRMGCLVSLLATLKRAYDADDRPMSRGSLARAMSFVATAVMLLRADGKVPAEVGMPDAVIKEADAAKNDFLNGDVRARAPGGFVTWGEDVRRAYLAHLWLARPFARADEDAFSAALALAWAAYGDGENAAKFGFVERTTSALTPWPAGAARPRQYFELLGGRDAPTVLKEVGTLDTLRTNAKQYGDYFILLPAPDDADALLTAYARKKGEAITPEAVLAALRAETGGAVSPGGASWYGLKTLAAGVLANPEKSPSARKLQWDEGYRKRFEGSLGGYFSQTRGRAAPAPTPSPGDTLVVEVYPEFRVEPYPEYYLHLARACGQLEETLSGALSKEGPVKLPSRREGGATAAPAWDDLAATKELLYGCYLLACGDVGIAPALTPADDVSRPEAIGRALEWLAGWRSDPDMKADIREAYPLAPLDEGAPEKGAYYRCVLGVRALDLEAKYDKKPVFSMPGWNRKADLHFKTLKYTVLVPVVVDVAVKSKTPLTRNELRKLCDEHKTRDAIVAGLEAWGQAPPAPAPEPKTQPPQPKVDKGVLILVIVLGVFALIVIIALIAGRPRDYYP